MKRASLLASVILWQLSSWLLQAEQEPAGLLLYHETPGVDVETIEFRSIRQNNLFSVIVTSTGQNRQVKMSGVAAELDYPPQVADQSLPDLARTMSTKIQTLERQFPSARIQLETVRGKWERAAAAYENMRKTKSVVAAQGKSVPALIVRAHQYSSARLTASTNDSVTIAHDAGVARIPLVEFDIPAIVFLNATSTTTQVDTVALLEQQALVAQSDSITGKIRFAGIRALSSVSKRTGILYDTLHTWLLFVIFPVLMLALIINSIVQGRKGRSVTLSKAR